MMCHKVKCCCLKEHGGHKHICKGDNKSKKNRILQNLKTAVSLVDERFCDSVCQHRDWHGHVSDRVRREDNPCLPKPSYVSATHYKDRLDPCFIEKQIGSYQVTMDGKVVCDRPIVKEVFKPTLPLPPWVRPRARSRELRSSMFYVGCDCFKKNGLQDDCPRWDCGGRPECMTKPFPRCDNSHSLGHPCGGPMPPSHFKDSDYVC